MPSNSNFSLLLQDRDKAILVGLFETRIMTLGHLSTIYFSGRKEATKKRLQTLKAAGLVSERTRRVNEPSVLYLSRKGHSLLTKENLLSGFPKLSSLAFEKRASVSNLTLRHELQVMDVKASFHSALNDSTELKITEFSTWPRLQEFKVSRPRALSNDSLVKPDGFMRLSEETGDSLFEHTFFLELDRSTETQGTLVNKVSCYLEYYRSGGFAARNGSPRSDYKDYPFRVLIVLKSAERRNNLAERLLAATSPIRTMAYLSTFAEVISDPVGFIWIRPADYEVARAQIEGTGPHLLKISTSNHSVRGDKIENSIKKHSLIETS